MTKKKSSNEITQVVSTSEQTNQDRLGVLKARLAVAKKWCEKPHKAFKKYIKEYEIEDIADTDEIRDKVRIGYVFRRVESDLPAIFDDQPELFLKGKGKNKVLDPLIEGTYDWLWDTQNMEEVIEDAAVYLLLLGMAAVKSPWVTKTEKVTQMEEQSLIDEMGNQIGTKQVPTVYEVPVIDNPQAEVVNPFKLYFSPETRFNPILDYAHCPYYFEKHVMSKEEIKARFGKDVDLTERLNIEDDEDLNIEIDKMETAYKDDVKRGTVYEYYGCLTEEMAKGIEGSEWTYDKEYHIWLTMNEELLVEECPYPSKPLFLVGNYGVVNKFWKFGEAKHLIPLVQELQAYRSQILKHTRKMANPKTLLPEDANVDEKLFSDPREGVVVKYQPGASGTKPEYLQPAVLGREVQVGVDMARTDLEKTSGSFDLASGGGQSQVKTPRGIAVYSEAADKTVRRKRKKIARLIRQLIIFQFRQLATNWTPDGTRSIEVVADGDSQKVPVVAEVLKVLGDANILAKIDIEIESLSLNKVQLKQDSLDLLDMALKSEAQSPGYVKIDEVWKDVLQNGFNKRDGDRYLFSPEERAQMQQAQAQAAAQPADGPNESINFKDLPAEGKVQLAAKAGLQLSPEGLAQQEAIAQGAMKPADNEPTTQPQLQ